jgi:hypothetical protein
MTPSPDNIGYGDKEPENIASRLDSISQTLDKTGKPIIGLVVEYKPLSSDSVTFVHPITGTDHAPSTWKVLGKEDFSSSFNLEVIIPDEYELNTEIEIQWGGKEKNKSYIYHLVDSRSSISHAPITDRGIIDRTTGKGVVIIANEPNISTGDMLRLCLGQKSEDLNFLDQIQKGLVAASTPTQTPTS